MLLELGQGLGPSGLVEHVILSLVQDNVTTDALVCRVNVQPPLLACHVASAGPADLLACHVASAGPADLLGALHTAHHKKLTCRDALNACCLCALILASLVVGCRWLAETVLLQL